VPSAVTFHDLADDDIPGGLRLCRQSGWNQTAADWKALLEAPSVFRGARVGSTLAGTAGAVVYGERLAWVCMVLVDPAERGRGLGTRLVEQVLERVPAGLVVGLDATTKGQGVYERLGFESCGAVARFETTSPTASAGGLPEARVLTEADWPRVLAYDKEVFGADRGRTLRAAFAAAPHYAWCVEERDTLVAYGLGRTGHDADQIGPVVGGSTPAATSIVAKCLRARPGRRFFLDAAPLPEWRQALADLGFREQRGFTRMYRGGRRLGPAGEEQCLAIFGPEFG
jgi:GNAT superfamily N-acetyltransferase